MVTKCIVVNINRTCVCCGKELTPKTVYGGFMGFVCRFSGLGKDWHTFSTCQKCRNLYASGYSTHKILMMKKKEYKDKFELIERSR